MGIRPIVTQTVVQELGYQSARGPTPAKKDIATKALTEMRQWGIQPAGVTPLGNGICDIVAERFRVEKVLPDGETHDIYVIIEASFYAVVYLVTWDSDMLDADENEVNRLLLSYDLNRISIKHPRFFLEDDC